MSSLCMRQARWCLLDAVSELVDTLRGAIAAISTWIGRRLRRARPAGTDLHVATGAVLLELLYADAEPTREQRRRLERALGGELGLTARARRAVMREAERSRGTKGVFASVRLVAESYSMPQKRRLVRIMHELVHLDGAVTGRERYLLTKLANLLRVDGARLADLGQMERARAS